MSILHNIFVEAKYFAADWIFWTFSYLKQEIVTLDEDLRPLMEDGGMIYHANG